MSQPVQDQLVVRFGCKFFLEKRSDDGPSLSVPLNMFKSDLGVEPNIGLSFQSEPDVVERNLVSPVVGLGHLVHPLDKLVCRDGVLFFLTPKFR